MDFDDMVTMVSNTTKRPDKVQPIKDAINAAISFFTLSASFMQDHVEGTKAVTATEYSQSITISTTFERFRRIDYLKRTGARKLMKPIIPQKAFDALENELTDRYYRSGNNLVMRFAVLTPTVEYGFFQYPELLEAGDATHWMFELCPFMVHQHACAKIFKDIGEPADSKSAMDEAMRLFLTAKTDFETATTAMAE